uniref:SCP domain-containing protein n=1 Tax=Maylandia zebra TaxID=106582 RepID=A0A3P9CSD0_9CICH
MGKDFSLFKKEFLHTHNAYRAQHGAPPLTFNTELDDAAQKWANQMLAKKKLETHRYAFSWAWFK